MKTCLLAAPALLILATSPAISASDAVPAWQEPGFVMEEIVVTATRPAWQRADFVMEEIVTTATADDVAAAQAELQQRHPRIRLSQLGDAATE